MPGPGVPVVAREASTVVLARDADGGLEVLLLERHRDSRMAPGAFAFPGGRVESTDAAAEWEPLCRALTVAEAARILPDVAPGAAIGFWVAAIREVFEETSLLLAYDRRGGPFETTSLGPSRLAAYRASCRKDSAAFRALVATEGLALATDRMAYWAHWITPEERPVRYDTRFFVAAALPQTPVEPDGIEVVAARWLTPEAALAHHRAGVLTLPGVTQEILGSVRPYSNVAALVEAAAAREVRPIRPRIIVSDGREKILLPGDPGWF